MKIIDNKLIADEGKVLVKGDVFGSIVHLGKNDSPENWTETDPVEITNEAATEEDYLQALERLGVE